MLRVIDDHSKVRFIDWEDHEARMLRLLARYSRKANVALREVTRTSVARRALEAYFAGQRQAFELDLDLRGAPLQLAVWRQLLEIPYGETTTYGEIAGRVDEPLYDPGVEP